MHYNFYNVLILLLFVNFTISTIVKGQVLDSVNAPSKSTTKNKLLVLPAVTHSPVTRWGGGVGASFLFKTKLNDSTIRTSNIETLLLGTENHQYLGVLGLNFYSPKETYIVRWRNSFSYFPDRFWGLGNRTPRSNLEHYTFEQFLINPQILRRIYNKIYVGINYEFQNVFKLQCNPEGLFYTENITGRNGGKVSGLGLTFAWDTRNNAFSSSKGAYLLFNVTPFKSWLGSDFQFTSVNLDLRKYFSIGKKQVIAFQCIGTFNNGNIPIRNLAALGGSDIMRGYYAGRYRDKSLAAFQTEFRTPVWKRLGLVVFGGLGEVFSAIKNIQGPLRYSFGGGVRYSVRKHERLNLRLDYGVGYKSTGYYFTIAEAF
jgi:outer membrane protein assembly factor BamA